MSNAGAYLQYQPALAWLQSKRLGMYWHAPVSLGSEVVNHKITLLDYQRAVMILFGAPERYTATKYPHNSIGGNIYAGK